VLVLVLVLLVPVLLVLLLVLLRFRSASTSARGIFAPTSNIDAARALRISWGCFLVFVVVCKRGGRGWRLWYTGDLLWGYSNRSGSS